MPSYREINFIFLQGIHNPCTAIRAIDATVREVVIAGDNPRCGYKSVRNLGVLQGLKPVVEPGARHEHVQSA